MSMLSGTYFRQSGKLFYSLKTEGSSHVGLNLYRRGLRGDVDCFSQASARRMRRYLRECVSVYKTFITLTYPFTAPTDGLVVKRDLKAFTQRLKRYCLTSCANGSFSAFWFLEFQARGAPHIHIFCTDRVERRHLSRQWYEVVGSEDERHLLAGTNVVALRGGNDAVLSYASKYAAKAEQKAVPPNYLNVGRFWGVVGNRSTVVAATFVDARHAGYNAEIEAVMAELRALISAVLREKRGVVVKKTDEFYCVRFFDLVDVIGMRLIITKMGLLTGYYNEILELQQNGVADE